MQWIQPNAFKDMCYDLMRGEERIATYRPLNLWYQSAIVESDHTTLRIVPNTWQTKWRIIEGDNREVTIITRLFRPKGRFTTAEGDTYAWQRTNLLTGERVFRRVGERSADVMYVRPSIWSLHTQVDLHPLSIDLPERDRVLLAGLVMHMIALERIPAVFAVILVVVLLPIIL